MTNLTQLHKPATLQKSNISTTQSHNTIIVQYESPECFNESLLYAMMQQNSLLSAVSLVNEINNLNKRKVVSDYQLYKIKRAFKSKNNQYFNGNSNLNFTDRQISNKQISFRQSDFEKEYQKAYMKMLSV